MPAVSVIVPSYNHARFLERRLHSILAQTLQDIEVLVLDDASTDGTGAILDVFASRPRVRIARSVRNSGSPFHQWNAGVARTSAPLVWIAESDDDAGPRLLQALVSRLDRNPACGLAFTQSTSVDADGGEHGSLTRWTDSVDTAHWRADYVNAGRDECARYLAVANTIPSASAVVFRRDVYERAGRAPESMRLAGDWMTWLRMLLISDVAFVAEPLNRHRTHAGTVRSSLARSARWYEESLAVWRLAHAELPLPPETTRKIVDIVRDVIVRLAKRPVANRRIIRDLFAFGRELDPGLPASMVRMVGERMLRRGERS
ncbi:MAG: glycosyltransferase family 2 protein [Vicinamibacterales bacterium]